MFVDEVIDLDAAPECWDVPQFHRVAYILDVSANPDCLRGKASKTRSVDRQVKKQVGLQKPVVLFSNRLQKCQDAWNGGTGSKKSGLAKVTILDEGRIVECRRSNLTCSGFFSCSLADMNHLTDFERWDCSGSATQDLLSAPTRAAKVAEANDVMLIAAAYIHSTCMGNVCSCPSDFIAAS
jgi:hypothetical protein